MSAELERLPFDQWCLAPHANVPLPTCGLDILTIVMAAKLPELDLAYTLRTLQQAFVGQEATIKEEGDDVVRFLVARFREHATVVLFASGKLIVCGCKTEWEALMAMNTIADPLHNSLIPCVTNTALTDVRLVNMIAKRYLRFKIHMAALKQLNDVPPHGVNEENGMFRIRQWRGFHVNVNGERHEKYASAQIRRGGLVLITGVASKGELQLFDAGVTEYLRAFVDPDQSDRADDNVEEADSDIESVSVNVNAIE
jgi:hypothetical protein